MIYLLVDEVNGARIHDAGIYDSVHTYWEHYKGVSLAEGSEEQCNASCSNVHPIFNSSPLFELLRDRDSGLDYRYLTIDDLKHTVLQEEDQIIYVTTIHYSPAFFAMNMHFLNDEVMEMCRAKECHIIFDGTYEGESLIWEQPDLGDKCFLDLYHDALEKNDLPLSHVAFFSNSMTAKDDYETWHARHPDVERTEVNYIMFDLVNATRLYDFSDGKWVPYDRTHMNEISIDFDDMIAYKLNNDAKYFLRINRSPKFERDYLLCVLGEHELLDVSLISHREHCDFTHINGELLRFLQDSEFSDSSIKLTRTMDLDMLSSLVPVDIDDSDTRNRTHYNADLPFDTTHYINSMWSIICTSFPEREATMHLTACVFNPIFFMHPFIIFGHHHTLKYLREYGFKTFGKWIDESYDDIEDFHERLVAVGEVVADLGSRTPDEMKSMLCEMEEILIHNRNVILNNTEMNKIDNLLRGNNEK